jgi:hypothetical protein
MKFKSYFLIILLASTACSDGDGDGKRRTFSFSVFDGEAPPVDGHGQSAGGATIKVYSSAQAWIDGTAPLKTFTVNADGRIETFDRFEEGNVVYAESGAYNNWPQFLTQANLFPDFDNTPNVLVGSATVYNTFLSKFTAIDGKSFLLTDVRINGSSVFESVAACSKDNFLKLTLGAKLVYSEGANVCTDEEALQEFTMEIPNSTTFAGELILNGNAFYQFYTPWATVANNVLVRKDFSEVWFKVNDGNETITVYTKQD